MGLILDLAIELPVYQRSTVYVYNTNVINPDSVPDVVNPYSSPLDRIWELEFIEGATTGGSNVDMGLVFGIFAAMLVVMTVVVASVYVTKKQAEKSPMLQYAVTLSDIESGNVRFPGQPKAKKQTKTTETSIKESTKEGEEEC